MSLNTGYPDYQRLSAQAGDLLGAWQPVIDGSQTIGTLDCHGYGYLDISVNDLGGSAYFTVQIIFDTAATGGVEAASFEFMPTPGGEQTLQFPVISRYCHIVVTWISGPTTDQPAVLAFGCNAIAPNRMTSQPSAPFIPFIPTVAAGGKATYMGTTTVQGGAVIAITASVSDKWSAYIKYFDAPTAQFQNYIEMFGASFGMSTIQTIAIPPSAWSIEIDNNDTVTQLFHISVTML